MLKSLPVKLTGTVTHGRKLGTEFNMPTANITPDIDISGLEYGVYYSKVTVDGETYKAISNLGKKPTVKEDESVNVETFLYDFEGDLYGKIITVELLEFRRPEQKFDSYECLCTEMHRDLEAGREYIESRKF